jgi:hypothetical protein
MKKLLVTIVVIAALGLLATPAAAEPPSTAPGFPNNWWPLVEEGKYFLNMNAPADLSTEGLEYGVDYFIGVEPRRTPPHVVFLDLNGNGVFIWQGQDFYWDASFSEAERLPEYSWHNPGKAANAWMTGKITTAYGNPPAPEDPPAGWDGYLYFRLDGVWTLTK